MDTAASGGESAVSDMRNLGAFPSGDVSDDSMSSKPFSRERTWSSRSAYAWAAA